jgi:hypothetical protein
LGLFLVFGCKGLEGKGWGGLVLVALFWCLMVVFGCDGLEGRGWGGSVLVALFWCALVVLGVVFYSYFEVVRCGGVWIWRRRGVVDADCD